MFKPSLSHLVMQRVPHLKIRNELGMQCSIPSTTTTKRLYFLETDYLDNSSHKLGQLACLISCLTDKMDTEIPASKDHETTVS